MIFRKLREKRINKIIDNIDKKDLAQRYTLLTLGCFIIAFAFNIFFDQYGLVCFGISGLSLVMKQFGILVLRFMNKEILTNLSGVCEYIDYVVKQRLKELRSSQSQEIYL